MVIQRGAPEASHHEQKTIDMETILADQMNPGMATVPAKRLASEAGLMVDGTVTKRAHMAGKASSQGKVVGKITNIDEDGVRVMWKEGEPEELHQAEELVAAQRPKQRNQGDHLARASAQMGIV